MDHEIRRPVAGSERTIVTVAREVDGEVVPLTREQKRGIPGTFDKIAGEAEKNASALLATMEPELVRDRRGVIEYAVIQSDNHRTASTVFAPDFGEKFAETIGPELFVAIPNRFQVFVFSRQDLAHLRMGEAIISGYLSSNYPVSREIFEWRNGRLRSLGLYR